MTYVEHRSAHAVDASALARPEPADAGADLRAECLLGHAVGFAEWAPHVVVFRTMLSGLAQQAERRHGAA